MLTEITAIGALFLYGTVVSDPNYIIAGSIRSAVERRQQIGVLRAFGFKRRMVQLGSAII